MNRIVLCVSIPIPRLRTRWTRYDTVRLDKTVKIRVIPAGVVEHQPEALGDSAGEWIVHVARLTCVLIQRHLVGRIDVDRHVGPRGADFALAQHPRSVTEGAGLVHSPKSGSGCFAIADFEHLVPVRVRGEGGGAEMVAEPLG